MKHWKRKPYFMLFTMTALLVLLAILATLQYRWIGQVSQGEQERLQESLRLEAKQFERDFDRDHARSLEPRSSR